MTTADRLAEIRARRAGVDGWPQEYTADAMRTDIDWLIARVEELEHDLTVAYRSIHRLCAEQGL